MMGRGLGQSLRSASASLTFSFPGFLDGLHPPAVWYFLPAQLPPVVIWMADPSGSPGFFLTPACSQERPRVWVYPWPTPTRYADLPPHSSPNPLPCHSSIIFTSYLLQGPVRPVTFPRLFID